MAADRANTAGKVEGIHASLWSTYIDRFTPVKPQKSSKQSQSQTTL